MAKCPGSYYCPVEATVDLIGGKYKAVILWHLSGGTKRFGEFRRLMPKITEKMLAQPVVPPKVEYNLSAAGTTIVPVLQAMCDWGKSYLQEKH